MSADDEEVCLALPSHTYLNTPPHTSTHLHDGGVFSHVWDGSAKHTSMKEVCLALPMHIFFIPQKEDSLALWGFKILTHLDFTSMKFSIYRWLFHRLSKLGNLMMFETFLSQIHSEISPNWDQENWDFLEHILHNI